MSIPDHRTWLETFDRVEPGRLSSGCVQNANRSCLLDPAQRASPTVTADAQTNHSATLCVSARHPALAGHFPGNPIVPGVVILDAVISAAEAWLGVNFHVASLSHAKFLTPLRPDEAARIELVVRGALLDFVVYCGQATIAKGTLSGSGGTTK
jgi:3-hydroxymyristoyl/3-hydroxydecanoyl-(acyl carrier protein) dehydratase